MWVRASRPLKTIAAVVVVSALAACGTLLGTDDELPVVPLDAAAAQADGGDGSASGEGGVSPVTDGSSVDAAADAAVDAGPTYRETVLSDGPIVYYRFEEPGFAPDAVDEMGNHTATYSAQIQVPGLAGGGFARKFSNEGVLTGPHMDLKFVGQSVFSIEAWVKPEAPDTTLRNVVGQFAGSDSGGQGYRLLATQSLLFRRARNGTGLAQEGVTTSAELGAGETHHVVATYDGATMRVFVDGTQKVSGSSAGLVLDDIGFVLNIGGGGQGASPFLGVIDEVAIYDHALAPGRISAHYAAR